MVTVKDKIDEIEAGTNFVLGSLITKHKSPQGVVLKWLEKNTQTNKAERKQRFFEITDNSAKHYYGWTVGTIIDIDPAQ